MKVGGGILLGDWDPVRYCLGPSKKNSMSFILMYAVTLSFFFPKWGHTLLNQCYFWFYDHLCEDAFFIKGKVYKKSKS